MARSLPESRFPCIDGEFDKAQYIDLAAIEARKEQATFDAYREDPGQMDRLYIRYSPLADSGVELERVTHGQVAWRIYADSMKTNFHTEYDHEVFLRVEGGIVFLASEGSAGTFEEERRVDTGELITRTVSRSAYFEEFMWDPHEEEAD